MPKEYDNVWIDTQLTIEIDCECISSQPATSHTRVWHTTMKMMKINIYSLHIYMNTNTTETKQLDTIWNSFISFIKWLVFIFFFFNIIYSLALCFFFFPYIHIFIRFIIIEYTHNVDVKIKKKQKTNTLNSIEKDTQICSFSFAALNHFWIDQTGCFCIITEYTLSHWFALLWWCWAKNREPNTHFFSFSSTEGTHNTK